MKILKNILAYWITIAIIYTVVYIITSFVIWEFKNPFKWIIDIPTYSTGERAALLFSYALSFLIIIPMSKGTKILLFDK